MTSWVKITQSAIEYILDSNQSHEIATIEMKKNKIKDWMKFRSLKEENKLYKDAKVDQEISHNT